MIAYVVSSLGLKLPESEKTPFLEEERKLRAQYHIDAEHWKRNSHGGHEGKGGQIETENYDGLAEHARLTDHHCLPDDHMGLVEPSGKQCIIGFSFTLSSFTKCYSFGYFQLRRHIPWPPLVVKNEQG
jgi:hypothetical protein